MAEIKKDVLVASLPIGSELFERCYLPCRSPHFLASLIQRPSHWSQSIGATVLSSLRKCGTTGPLLYIGHH